MFNPYELFVAQVNHRERIEDAQRERIAHSLRSRAPHRATVLWISISLGALLFVGIMIAR